MATLQIKLGKMTKAKASNEPTEQDRKMAGDEFDEKLKAILAPEMWHGNKVQWITTQFPQCHPTDYDHITGTSSDDSKAKMKTALRTSKANELAREASSAADS